MLLVVDANVVLSALLTKGSSFAVFSANRFTKKFEFLAPEFLLYELNKNVDTIIERSKLSFGEIDKVFSFLMEEIDFVPFEEFNRFARDAEKIAPHPKDVIYFALALAFNCPIWSNEKRLKGQQKQVKVYTTSDLLSRLAG